jgi:hypothetical protein
MALGFKHPFTCTIAGPTQCGKTVFVQKLLKALPYYITPTPQRVVWAHGVHNGDQIKRIIDAAHPIQVEFVDSIPSLDIFHPEENNLLIIDDLMCDAGRNKAVADLFTKGCHHRNISVILILQNLFHQGKVMRDIHTSTNYSVLFHNPRDSSQLLNLQRQCFPYERDFLLAAYKHACSQPYGYLVFDFHQSTPAHFRVSSDIFPPNLPTIYNPSEVRRK